MSFDSLSASTRSTIFLASQPAHATTLRSAPTQTQTMHVGRLSKIGVNDQPVDVPAPAVKSSHQVPTIRSAASSMAKQMVLAAAALRTPRRGYRWDQRWPPPRAWI
jgi:hypothetical protein